MSSVAAPPLAKVPNYIGGEWRDSSASEWQNVVNPATGRSNSIQKYKEYAMTGFLKSVAPIVIDHASGVKVWDENGREYLDCIWPGAPSSTILRTPVNLT